jgi:DNA modification methylase
MKNQVTGSLLAEKMEVTMWPLERIIPYPRNARKIPPEAVDKVAASIREFGWRVPIVVDKNGVIICGHTRLLAARKLGLREAPVHVAANLTPAQVRAYRLLDNRSHEETSWDEDLLGLELLDLKGMGVDLDLTGFNMDEIDNFLANAEGGTVGLTDDDAAPELSETAITVPGDSWTVGDHRVLCADATQIENIEKVMNGSLADLVFSDPPYNVGYGGGPDKHGRKRRRIANDDLGLGFGEFLHAACRNMLEVTKGSLYICMSSSEIDTLKKAFIDAGGHWSTFVIWAKNTFTLGRSDYQRQYEPMLYGWKEGTDHFWCGARDQGDVWFVDKPRVNEFHPTQKPVELIERAIRNSSKGRDTILDPFAGSGSTLIACEKTGRHARLIELDPRYVDCTVQRWQAWSGKTATLDGDGRLFDEIAAERLQLAAGG